MIQQTLSSDMFPQALPPCKELAAHLSNWPLQRPLGLQVQADRLPGHQRTKLQDHQDGGLVVVQDGEGADEHASHLPVGRKH